VTNLAHDFGSPTVTEINATSGALVETLSDASFGFNEPDGVVAESTNLWVANYAPGTPSGSVSEINEVTSSVVGVLTGTTYGFSGADSITFGDNEIWVANWDSNSVVEFPAS
jgi:hypothetical protein